MNGINSSHTKLFLFDIDGTLLSVKKGFMHQLIERILAEYGMSDIDISQQYFAGRTDRDIFNSILNTGNHYVDESLFQSFKNTYIRTLKKELLPAYVHLMEHVREVIDYFTDRKYLFGLLTGNFKESAYIKLQKAGIDHFFDFGVFGSDHTDRNDLPAIAHDSAQKYFKTKFSRKDIIIIGDTPKDVLCAHQYGATSIAVATGSYTQKELSHSNPDYLLKDLSNPDSWLISLNSEK